MSIPVRKVSKAVQVELDALPTVYKRIKYLQKEGWSRADVARKLGTTYQHVNNEWERTAKNPR